MSDDIKLEETTSTESPTETKQDVPDDWSQLSGKSQERFKKAIALKNEALRKAEELEARVRSLESLQAAPKTETETYLNNGSMTPEEEVAAKRLKQLGFMTKEEVERKEKEREAQLARERLNEQHGRLKEQFANKYGEKAPVYDDREVEDYMLKTGIWDPEYAFEKLYKDELRQLEVEQLKSKDTTAPTRTKSRISAGQPWTPEALAERAKQPGWIEFYKKNKDKIDSLYSEWGGR